MTEHEKLVAEIERFLKRTGMSPSRFSADAVGQRSLMIRLRRGEGVTLATVDRLRKFMREYNVKKKPSGKRLEYRASA